MRRWLAGKFEDGSSWYHETYHGVNTYDSQPEELLSRDIRPADGRPQLRDFLIPFKTHLFGNPI